MEKDEYAIMYDLEKTYWWFAGKQFLVKNILKRFPLNGLKKEKILDIGCGTGVILKLLERFGVAYGVEISPEAIRFLKKRNLNFIVRSDANQPIPFKNDTFSAITCLDVLEHLEDDFILLSELVRVCQPGRHIVITVPAFKLLWSPHDIALHHKRRYALREMLNKVSSLNCAVIKASYYNTCLFIPILVVRKMKLFCANKKPVQSDFFLPFPKYLNKILTLLYTTELGFLRFFRFPFGVSLLLVLQKLEPDKA